MKPHLSEAQLVDALFARALGAQADHLAACAVCRTRLAAATEGLSLARSAAVPEPSPLYWQLFARQLDGRLRAQRPSRRPWLAPLLAAAAAALALVSLLPRLPSEPVPAPSSESALWQALPPLEQDAGARVLEGLGATLEEAYLLAGCELDECLADLSEAERRDLARLLSEELAGRES